ncbi:hypothetical protein Lfu02_72490 [Longispora fulva]|uniref:Beta-glucuronidase n=1 Tax=Longispora fulva TaxID=619741 RepID=A0A8J7GDR4_9ACTN|nr:glycoside hydrolase family 2 TIM barrel-domain containing protein [Longispora fulva]MBG6133838.1 beta-glucuronidase [Longispora fulva]GIG62877.1 hypothetical protein Lfu02_72490 [Longispora fulva]
MTPSPLNPPTSRRTVLRAAALTAPALALPALAASPATAGTGAPAPAAAPGPLAFTQPTSSTLSGLTDIEVTAPAGTTAVRFTLGGLAFAELTDLYSKGTGLAPVWRTATDAAWFPSGAQVLKAEADTPSGLVKTEMNVTVTAPPAPPAGRIVLNGAWMAAKESELPSGALTGTSPSGCQPNFSETAMTSAVVPGALGAIRAKWNVHAGQVALYRKKVTLAAPTTGQRTLITFESCFYVLKLFVNGTAAGTATGGYLPETFDITNLVTTGVNTIAVIVDNRFSEIFSNRNPGLYWNYGGIFDSVNIDRTEAVAITDLAALGASNGTLTLRASGVNASGSSQNITTTVQVTTPSGQALPSSQVTFALPAGTGKVISAPVTVNVSSPQLWSPASPALYTVTATPPSGKGNPQTVSTGFRDIAISGNKLMLNGQALAGVRGFNRHTDYPGLGRCQPDGLALRELTELRNKGFTIFRPGHYPTTPGELAAADKLGLMVIEELNVTHVFDDAVLSGTQIVNFGKERLGKMIARDRSHPSIIGWSVGNENGTNTATGANYVKNVVAYGKTLDTARIYTHMTGWGADDAAFGYDDLASTNIYNGWYVGTFDTLTDPNGGSYSMISIEAKVGTKPILLSEYGAEAVSTNTGFGKGTEYYQGLMVDEYNRILAGRPGLVGTMYWTSTEFALNPDGGGGAPKVVPGYHNKGLMTYWRDYYKLGYKVLFSPVRIDVPPPVAWPAGSTGPVSVTLTIRDIRNVASSGTLQVTPPQGCTVDTASTPFTVAAGNSTTVTVKLSGTPTAGGTPGMVRAVIDSQTEAMPRQLTTSGSSYPNLAAAFNNIGTTDDANPSVGTLSTSGKSYSRQALAALGYKPGATVTHQGTTFTWPNVAAGQPDNVAATGQTIALSGSGTKIAILGTGTYGAQGGDFIVRYSDGTQSTKNLKLDDWYASTATTGDVAAAVCQYHNGPSGKVTHSATVWRADIAVTSGKTIVSLQLPNSGNPPAACLHVFALTIA